MKTAFYTFLSVVALSVNVQAANVDFSQAWYQVVQKNDGLQAKKEGVIRSEAIQDAAKSLYLPNIDITGSYTYFNDPVEIDTTGVKNGLGSTLEPIIGKLPPEDQQKVLAKLGGLPNGIPLTNDDFKHASLNVMLPVYTGGRITAAQDIRAAQVTEALSHVDLAERQAFATLVRYYFGVVLTDQVYQTRLDAVDALSNHLDHALKLEKHGQIAKVERLQAQVSLDKAQIDARKALRDKEIAQLALSKLLKANEDVLPTTPLFVNNDIGSVTPYMNKALAKHPGLKILDAKKRQADGAIDVAKGKHLPEVMLYGNYNLYEDDSPTGRLVPEWMVGVGVKIPLLEREGTSSKVAAAQSQSREVIRIRAQMEQDLTVLVEKTYREMMQSLEEYNSLASSLAMAKENVSLREKGFNQGLSTSLDVVDAQLFVTSIRTQRLAASYNYINSLAQLLSVSGEINSFMDYLKINGIEVK